MNTILEFDLTSEQRLLCLCIRHCDYLDIAQIIDLYESIGDDRLFEEAELNGVASIVAHALEKCLGEKHAPLHWRNVYDATSVRIENYMHELERAARLLEKHNVRLLALKNSGITRGFYPHFGACPMGDIDVLVSKASFKKSHEILSDAGYKLKFRCPFEEESLEAALEAGGAEYSVTLAGGEHLWFELQWRPVAGRWIQPEQEPGADELIERSVSIAGSAVRLLSPEDNLLQVSLHTAKHTFVRAPGFRLHTDVDRIVSSQEIDWALFTSRVKHLRTKTAVFLSLAMAKSLLGTPVPDEVLNELSPSLWKIKLMKGWLERVGIFEPDAPKWSRVGYMIFVSLLYDSVGDFMRGVVPSNENMKQQYEFSSNWLLPYYHLRRLSNLLFRRINT
ncbi:MAG: nucleotidyltransferase family protein [Ectothiorhodospiraceae bacterium]|nr:nucleotidyltransferase family protein [Ectothiorhodospiraceae bacterium]